jgi:hypothetical protein
VISTPRIGNPQNGASRSGAVKSEIGAGCISTGQVEAASCSTMVSTFILMPIAYQRDDQRRLITLTVTEPCSVDDISSVIDSQAGEDTWEYALLYDLRAMTDASTEAGLQQLVERVNVVGAERKRGPVGIAIRARPALFLLGLMYTKLIKEFVTIELLLTAAQIDAWLIRNAPGGSSRRQ